MVSYGAGTRYLSLIGGALLSFYDWYCDLPPSSPQTWGEQTDVPESEAWYYSSYIIVWGTNISMTRFSGRALLNRSSLQRNESRKCLSGLLRSHERRGLVDTSQTGYRCGTGYGCQPRHL